MTTTIDHHTDGHDSIEPETKRPEELGVPESAPSTARSREEDARPDETFSTRPKAPVKKSAADRDH